MQQNQAYFGATVQGVDFSSPTTKDVINSWVNTQTQGKIPTILKETMPEDVLYPLNVPGPTASTQKTRARDRFIRKAAAPSPRTS